MIHKIDFDKKSHEVFAEPTPLGLIGLAIGCAALTPIAFGHSLTPAGLKTAAVLCLLFGGGCQLLAGLMNFANKNLFGGTILTAFSFNWMMNYWALDAIASGTIPDHSILLATDGLFLLIFAVLTYGFGFFSKLLFVFLLDIDLLYVCKVVKGVTGTKALDLPVALLTIALGLIALWIAFAALINPTAGRPIFKVPGPMFAVPEKTRSFDWSMRNALFEVLYQHWSNHAMRPMALEDLTARMKARVGDRTILPDLGYLIELEAVAAVGSTEQPEAVRLTASGIDLYEQLILKKYDF
ncbi:MAG: GPR1/FUN34/YaaH family transporter [Byssovorax sp.]